MRFPIPQISISVLLVHVILGCCWHHAHSCAINCCEQPNATTVACACGVHQHKHHEGDDAHKHRQEDTPPKDGRDSEPHRCAGEHCTFLRSQRLAEQIPDFYHYSLPLEATASNSFDVQSILAAQSMQAFAFDRRHCEEGPPIRLHLLLSILVI